VPEAKWSFSAAVRGKAGIHAARMPYDWRRASLKDTELEAFAITGTTQLAWIAINSTFNSGDLPETHIIGIVERFGKYVLGTEGWRAEWVIIKALKAPTTEVGLLLEQAYPDVEVYYE
jgi:hypothetical protein